MIRSWRVLLLVATIVAGAAVARPAPRSVGAQSPSITVTPASGNQYETFTFTGTGFAPGTELAETYTAPDGDEYTFFIGGVPAVVVAGDDGSFAVDVHPATDFEGADAGMWTVKFCITGGGDCWTGTITITL